MTSEIERLRDQLRQVTERVARLEARGHIPDSMRRYKTNQRPQARDFPVGAAIWNTTNNNPNWSDGQVWRDSNGDQV